MTTKLHIGNDHLSNGDIHIEIVCGETHTQLILFPGEKTEQWVTTEHKVHIHETHPTKRPYEHLVCKPMNEGER